VRGIDLVQLPGADSCCGFGGAFAVKNSDTSTAMLADKLASVLTTGAEVLCAADSSCLMHIGGGLSRLRAGVRTVRLAEILAATDKSATDREAIFPSPWELEKRAGASEMNDVVFLGAPSFPDAARAALADPQLRSNLRKATGVIRDRRAAAVAELGDWEALRDAGAALRRRTSRHLDT